MQELFNVKSIRDITQSINPAREQATCLPMICIRISVIKTEKNAINALLAGKARRDCTIKPDQTASPNTVNHDGEVGTSPTSIASRKIDSKVARG